MMSGRQFNEDVRPKNEMDESAVVIVEGIRSVSKDALEMFFESKKKSAGGEIRSLEINDTEGTARIVYEDPSVASRVLERGTFTLSGHTLTVEPPPAAPEYDVLSIVVEGIHPSVTPDALELLFESKKKTRGGDVKEIEYHPGSGSAIITFEETEVAQRVIAYSQEKSINHEGRKLIVHPQVLNMDKSLSEPEPVDPKVVVVEEIHPDTKYEVLEMFLESKKKSGGGDIEKLDYEKDSNTATVTFECEEVAQRILQQEVLTLEGATLIVHAPEPQPKPDRKKITKTRIDAHHQIASGTMMDVNTIAIENIGSTPKNHLKMKLENETSGGGPVKKINIFPERNLAVVKYKYAKDARNILEKGSLTLADTACCVYPLDTTVEDSQHFKGTQAICVTGIPPKTSEEMIQLFFSNKRSGGGEIFNVYLDPLKDMAVVTFMKVETVDDVISKHVNSPLILCKVKLQIEKMKSPVPPRLVIGASEPKKMLVIDAPELTREELELYLSQFSGDRTLNSDETEHLSSGPELKQVLFSAVKSTIIMEFTSMPDFEALLLFSATHPIKDTMLTLQRVALPTKLQVNFDEGLNLEMLELYFQNPGKSGGNTDVVVEEENEDESYAILQCPSPAVVKAIMGRKHKIDGRDLELSIYYQEFGVVPRGYDPTQPWDTRAPLLYIHHIADPKNSLYIYEFLKMSDSVRDLITGIGQKTNLFNIIWEGMTQEGLPVSCTDGYKLQSKQTWEELCRKELDTILRAITVDEIATLAAVYDRVLEEARRIAKGSVYICTRQSSECVVMLTGLDDDVKQIQEKLNRVQQEFEEGMVNEQLILEQATGNRVQPEFEEQYMQYHDVQHPVGNVKQEFEGGMVNKDTVKEVLKIKHHEGVLLRAMRYFDRLLDSNPSVQVKFIQANEIYISGPRNKVQTTKLMILEEVLENVTSIPYLVPESMTAWLKLKQTRESILREFKHAKIIAVMDIGNDDVTFHTLSANDAGIANSIVQKYIEIEGVPYIDMIE